MVFDTEEIETYSARAPAQVAAGTLKVPIGKTFRLDDIVEAHRCMDENRAGGKIVILP